MKVGFWRSKQRSSNCPHRRLSSPCSTTHQNRSSRAINDGVPVRCTGAARYPALIWQSCWPAISSGLNPPSAEAMTRAGQGGAQRGAVAAGQRRQCDGRTAEQRPVRNTAPMPTALGLAQQLQQLQGHDHPPAPCSSSRPPSRTSLTFSKACTSGLGSGLIKESRYSEHRNRSDDGPPGTAPKLERAPASGRHDAQPAPGETLLAPESNPSRFG